MADLCGRASEILLSAHAVEEPAQQEGPVVEKTLQEPAPTEQESEQEPEAVTEASTVEDPAFAALEVLPDDELKALAQARGVVIDGRWGRSRLLQALKDAGVNSPVAPPPPPAE